MLGRARIVLGGLRAQRRHVLEESPGVWLDVLLDCRPRVHRLVEDPIIDVGQVHDMRDPKARHAKVPADEVVKEKRTQVSDVREVPHRRTTGVHAHKTRFEWLEDVLRPAESVVQAQRIHLPTPWGGRRAAPGGGECFTSSMVATAWAAMPAI